MKLKATLTSIVLALFISTAAMAQESRLFASDKLTDPNVRAICQDKYGYIWIGTRSGLNKFDGYRFTAYRHHRGDKVLPSNYDTYRNIGLWFIHNPSRQHSGSSYKRLLTPRPQRLLFPVTH